MAANLIPTILTKQASHGDLYLRSAWIMKENSCVKNLSVGELLYWFEERETYRKEYALHWNKHGIDSTASTHFNTPSVLV